MDPIQVRERFYQTTPDIFNHKIGPGELDFHYPVKGTVAKWVGEVEKRVSKIHFKPAWGRMCLANRCISFKSPSPFAAALDIPIDKAA